MIIRQSYEHGEELFSIRHHYNESNRIAKTEWVPYGTPREQGEIIMPRVGLNDEYFELIWNNAIIRRQRELVAHGNDTDK